MSWINIADYNGDYKINELGEIKSIRRIIVEKKNKKRILNERILKPVINCAGYYVVSLHNNANAKTHLIHRLLAIAFIPNPEKKPQINHKDKNKLNNNLSNIEWCTSRENSRHSNAKKVKQLSLSGDLINIWDCMSDIKINDINKFKTINSLLLRNKSRISSNYKWEYV